MDTEDIAQQFDARLAGVRRVWQQFREEGRDCPAYADCGRKPTLDEAGKQQFLEIARHRPDAFCSELAEEVEQKLGVKATRQTIGRWLRDLGPRRRAACGPTRPSEMLRRALRAAKNAGATDVWGCVVAPDCTDELMNWYRRWGFSIIDADEECATGLPGAIKTIRKAI